MMHFVYKGREIESRRLPDGVRVFGSLIAGDESAKETQEDDKEKPETVPRQLMQKSKAFGRSIFLDSRLFPALLISVPTHQDVGRGPTYPIIDVSDVAFRHSRDISHQISNVFEGI